MPESDFFTDPHLLATRRNVRRELAGGAFSGNHAILRTVDPAPPTRSTITRAISTFMLMVAGSACMAQGGGLLDAPACRRAMDALEAREASATNERNGTQRTALEAARRQAAIACLGGSDRTASAPPRAAQPAATAGRPAASTPMTMPMPAAPSPPAPRPARSPLTLGACDATGCWVSDGSRLQRAGPNLLGPTGVCTTSGPFVQCPP